MREETKASPAEAEVLSGSLLCRSWTKHPKSQSANHRQMSFQRNNGFIHHLALVRPVAELHS